MEITFSERYNIMKYNDISVGIKEVIPDKLAKDITLNTLVINFTLAQDALVDYIEDNTEYEN